MEQRISFITIGVNDLDKVKEFYIEKFGWTPMHDADGIVFFKHNGFIFSLYPNHELAEDATVPFKEQSGSKGFALAQLLRSEAEVDALVADLASKGVKVVKQPQKVFWGGYSSYVEDIEGNLWEIAYNPFMPLDEAGNVA